MAFKIELISNRPDPNTPFWWEVERPEEQQIIENQLDLTLTLLEIQHQVSKSNDLLTYTKTYVVPNLDVWFIFMDVVMSFCDIIKERNTYFRENQHTLSLVKTHIETGEVVDSFDIYLK